MRWLPVDTGDENIESKIPASGYGRGGGRLGLHFPEPEAGILINEFPIVDVMGTVTGEGQTYDTIDDVEGCGT